MNRYRKQIKQRLWTKLHTRVPLASYLSKVFRIPRSYLYETCTVEPLSETHKRILKLFYGKERDRSTESNDDALYEHCTGPVTTIPVNTFKDKLVEDAILNGFKFNKPFTDPRPNEEILRTFTPKSKGNDWNEFVKEYSK